MFYKSKRLLNPVTARLFARVTTKEPSIFRGETVIINKSKFVAHCAEIQNDVEFESVMNTLLQDKKIQSATHNISAYRIKQGDEIVDYNNDDGESGASDWLLTLLKRSNAHNVCVIVTRWYGGV
jgi:putative IMPACT (imprinted ancient) family translation regulator